MEQKAGPTINAMTQQRPARLISMLVIACTCQWPTLSAAANPRALIAVGRRNFLLFLMLEGGDSRGGGGQVGGG
jgi:hypothetical protein